MVRNNQLLLDQKEGINFAREDTKLRTKNRFVSKSCERWALSSDSESDFSTHLEQVKSEKSRKMSTQVKWSYKNRNINKD